MIGLKILDDHRIQESRHPPCPLLLFFLKGTFCLKLLSACGYTGAWRGCNEGIPSSCILVVRALYLGDDSAKIEDADRILREHWSLSGYQGGVLGGPFSTLSYDAP